MQGPPAPRPSPSPQCAHQQSRTGRTDRVAAWGVGGGWNVRWGCIVAMPHGPRQGDDEGLGGPSSFLLGGLLPPPFLARTPLSSTPPPSARRCRFCSTVASNNGIDAAARDIVSSSSSFERTMGHMRDVPRLDVSTVSPHYAGALDDATTGESGGRTRHIAFVVHLPRPRTTRRRRRRRRRRPPLPSPQSGDNERRNTMTTIANGDGADNAVGGDNGRGSLLFLFFVK